MQPCYFIDRKWFSEQHNAIIMIDISEKSINFKTTLPIKIIYCGNPEFIKFYRKYSPVICKHFLLMKSFTVNSYQEVGCIKQTKTAALRQS